MCGKGMSFCHLDVARLPLGVKLRVAADAELAEVVWPHVKEAAPVEKHAFDQLTEALTDGAE